MYIRFVTPQRARMARSVAAGLFGPAYKLRDDRAAAMWLRQAAADEIGWFCEHLDVPDRFGVVTRKSNRRYGGVCWFRDNARQHIAHAYALASILDEAGVPVTRIISDAPGDIVWRDAHQIVAMPRHMN